eukprot:Gb_29997 [translate_table: standard]
MWNRGHNPAPQGQRLSKSAPCSPAKPLVKKAPSRAESFHVVHKVPLGDTPYVKAKHVQLVDKDPDRAIALFWAAINAGDRVDSALKDMAIVMKQQNRPEEAIEAIKSLRNRCSDQAQESLDNVLLDLYKGKNKLSNVGLSELDDMYMGLLVLSRAETESSLIHFDMHMTLMFKRCGRLDDQTALLKHKLNLIHQGLAFNGRRTKTARSQGKKFQVSIEQEATRLLGNLGWAYMQQSNYIAAEAVYRKALSIEPDNNKMCNLGICLMNQGRVSEAKTMLQSVKAASANGPWGLDSHLKSYERAQEMLREIEAQSLNYDSLMENSVEGLKSSVWQSLPCPWKHTPHNLSENEKLSSDSVVSGANTFFATSGFGLSLPNSMFGTGLMEENTEEDTFGDENMNINIGNVCSSSLSRAPFGFTKNCQTQQGHAESLRQKLEKVCLKENGNARRSPFPPPPCSNTEHVLNSAAPPFFSRNVNPRDNDSIFSNALGSIRNIEERVPLTLDRTNEQRVKDPMALRGKRVLGSVGDGTVNPTAFSGRSMNQNRPATRRSLSFESIDYGLDLPPLSSIQTCKMSKADTMSQPLQENPADPWDSLGFIQSPDNKDFEQAILSALSETSNSEFQSWDDKALQQHKCQGRLRVFQEMTLPASPKV